MDDDTQARLILLFLNMVEFAAVGLLVIRPSYLWILMMTGIAFCVESFSKVDDFLGWQSIEWFISTSLWLPYICFGYHRPKPPVVLQIGKTLEIFSQDHLKNCRRKAKAEGCENDLREKEDHLKSCRLKAKTEGPNNDLEKGIRIKEEEIKTLKKKYNFHLKKLSTANKAVLEKQFSQLRKTLEEKGIESNDPKDIKG